MKSHETMNLESALNAVTKKELAQRNIIKILTLENRQLKKQLKHYREFQRP
jgi:hypothetical protein